MAADGLEFNCIESGAFDQSIIAVFTLFWLDRSVRQHLHLSSPHLSPPELIWKPKQNVLSPKPLVMNKQNIKRYRSVGVYNKRTTYLIPFNSIFMLWQHNTTRRALPLQQMLGISVFFMDFSSENLSSRFIIWLSCHSQLRSNGFSMN